MDPKLIYRKTPQGEEALKERTQLKAGRLRAALIMVDGHASAGELLLRLGRKNRPDDRLAQLERLGLIEPVPQSRRPKSGRTPQVAETRSEPAAAEAPQAAEAPAPEALRNEPAATAEPLQEALPETPAEAEAVELAPAEPEAAPPSAKTEPEPAAADAEAGVQPPPPAPTDVEESAPASTAPPTAADVSSETAVEAGPEATEEAAPAESEAPTAEASSEPSPEPSPSEQSLPLQESVTQEFTRPPGAVAPVRSTPSLAARLRAALALPERRGKSQAAAAPAKLRVPSRRPGPVTWIGMLVLALAATAALLPGYLRPEIEAWASARIGQPVSAESVGLALEPAVGLRLKGVAVGASRLARAAQVVIRPSVHGVADLLHLRFDLDVYALTLEGEAIVALCAVAGIDAATVRASRIDTISIDGLALALPRATLAELRANIDLDPATGRARVSLGDHGGRLRAEISPAPRGCRFAASGSGWHPPQVPGVTLDALRATGTVDDRLLRLERFDARTSDGLIVGSGSLEWEPSAKLDLRFELQHLDLAKLLASLGVPPSARGELDATLHLSASASQLSLLPAALAGGGPVTVSRGTIERFDLVEAARNPGTDRVHGGALRFEELKAQFQIDRGGAALRNLRLSAGALTADGSLSIRRDATLGGSLSAHLKGAAGEIQVPLRVAGTVAAPELGASAETPAGDTTTAQKQ